MLVRMFDAAATPGSEEPEPSRPPAGAFEARLPTAAHLRARLEGEGAERPEPAEVLEPVPVEAASLAARRARAHALVDQLFCDPHDATTEELCSAIEARAELATLADGAAIGVLPRWEGAYVWRNSAYASPTAWVVGHTGARRAAVASLRRTSDDCHALPALEAAAGSGQLSLEHLRLLCALRRRTVTRERFDRDVHRLTNAGLGCTADRYAVILEVWYQQTLVDLAENEPDTPPDDQTDGSTLHLHRSFQGRGQLDGTLTPEHAAALTEALDARISRWRRDGQLDHDERRLDELRAEALMELIAEAAVANRRGQARPLVIVTATLAALLERAAVGPGERDRWRAEILDGGPIGAKALRALLTRANLQMVVTDDDGHPLHVGRARRLATAAMYAALIATSGGRCEHPTCNAPHHRCHAHHVRWWSQGGETELSNLTSG